MLGGPGSGKSTTAAAVFAELKWLGVVAELVQEYAKDKVWEGHFNILSNQFYVFAKQHQRLLRLEGQVEVAITDSSILNSIIYNNSNPDFNSVVLEEYKKFNNLNFFIQRKKDYVQIGRTQTESEAIDIDGKIKNLLDINEIPYVNFVGAKDSINAMIATILQRLKHETLK